MKVKENICAFIGWDEKGPDKIPTWYDAISKKINGATEIFLESGSNFLPAYKGKLYYMHGFTIQQQNNNIENKIPKNGRDIRNTIWKKEHNIYQLLQEKWDGNMYM